ncbi:MAG: hypothetical protein ICV73_28075, partial [Acetobacteraceae bacterium]|nr:hypothetical protein [Acetobacteraceae bacterium]
MGVPIAAERRMLTEAEFEAVARTHYPAICGSPKEELLDLARPLREYHGKARDIARHRRRERRGKAEPRGATPAPSEAGLSMKKQVFASALKRVNREIGRLERVNRRPSLAESARRALEMKRAGRVRHHPSAGRTASLGMRPAPN